MLMGNSEPLDVFRHPEDRHVRQPQNTGLREGLGFIIDNSDTGFLVVDHDKIDFYRSVAAYPKIRKVIVNTLEAPAGFAVPDGMLDLRKAYEDMPGTKPEVSFDPDSLLLIMYTSGTTGLPKGVVSRYNKNLVTKLGLLASIILTPDSIYYTPLALFHGNGLFVTTTTSLMAGSTVALSKKFSASRFWDEICRSKATIFNTIGAMIPILSQPTHPLERSHTVCGSSRRAAR